MVKRRVIANITSFAKLSFHHRFLSTCEVSSVVQLHGDSLSVKHTWPYSSTGQTAQCSLTFLSFFSFRLAVESKVSVPKDNKLPASTLTLGCVSQYCIGCNYVNVRDAFTRLLSL